ncbi:PREDICTED: mitogen-activated protein kinase homolog MMK2-like [Tarenaya hassleriana]|uniref:mitogen-activated protein kinase homolog MMK2-like n=1 Tax=Tarenaya hassleriana TaxID=28532 RepID=UPI00053C6989|nr:PREDICTED: mitogen-activated protein kinase homolog MMK2-like [Tarenaya hassleriana]
MSTERETEEGESSSRGEIGRGHGYALHLVSGIWFELPLKYASPVRPIGNGTYGYVCSAVNSETKEEVAIKKISKPFINRVAAKMALREIKLLLHMDHKDVISIKDVIRPYQKEKFDAVYIVYEFMPEDLHHVLKSDTPLKDDHYRCFLYQILRGLKYIHSGNVLHLDLKPKNLLVNEKCDLKIADFGFARTISGTEFMEDSEVVVTPAYRAPELILGLSEFTAAIDVWSVGCIFAEMVKRAPLFHPKKSSDLLRIILELIGSPDEASMDFLRSEDAIKRVQDLSPLPRQNFTDQFPDMSPNGVDLLEKMLVFDPRKRITVQEALCHPYLSHLHDDLYEPVCSEPISFDFENQSLSEEEIKELVWRETLKFYPEPIS